MQHRTLPVSNAPAPAPDAVQQAQAMAGATGAHKAAAVDQLVDGLKARLQRQPDDIDGWVLLGRSYHFMQRWDDAAAAFAKARALGWKGEAPPINNGGNGQGMAGSAGASAGDAVFAGVEAAVQERGRALQVPHPSVAANTSVVAVVSADTALTRRYGPNTAIFIFARPAQGPPMPLAVVRATLGSLPASVELSDAQAMMPGHNLSSSASVIIGARLSPSGSPLHQPGDIEALSSPLAPQGQRVALTLRSAR